MPALSQPKEFVLAPTCPQDKLKAENFLASLKGQGLRIKSHFFGEPGPLFGEKDVVRALYSAFAKGKDEQAIKEKLADLLKSKDPVDAQALIDRINDVIGGSSFQRDRRISCERSARLNGRRSYNQSFFTRSEGLLLSECNVPAQRIRSGELTARDKERILRSIERLDPEARMGMRLDMVFSRFGLDGSAPLSLDEIAEAYSRTKNQVRDRIKDALHKIRNLPPALSPA